MHIQMLIVKIAVGMVLGNHVTSGILMKTKIGHVVTSEKLSGSQFCMNCLWEKDFINVPAP